MFEDLVARLLDHADIHDSDRRGYPDTEQAQYTNDLRVAVELLRLLPRALTLAAKHCPKDHPDWQELRRMDDLT